VYLTKGDYSKAKEKLAEVVEQEGAYGYGLHVESIVGISASLDPLTPIGSGKEYLGPVKLISSL